MGISADKDDMYYFLKCNEPYILATSMRDSYSGKKFSLKSKGRFWMVFKQHCAKDISALSGSKILLLYTLYNPTFAEFTHYTINNLSRFQKALRNYGVPSEELFQTPDLFERRNIKQVTLSLLALARCVSIQRIS